MKFLINLTNIQASETHWVFPKFGDTLYVKGIEYVVTEFNHEANDAGFGWVWLYNTKTQYFDYKMSIFSRQTIPGNTIIPDVGINNADALNSIAAQKVKENGIIFSWKNIWLLLKGLFN